MPVFTGAWEAQSVLSMVTKSLGQKIHVLGRCSSSWSVPWHCLRDSGAEGPLVAHPCGHFFLVRTSRTSHIIKRGNENLTHTHSRIAGDVVTQDRKSPENLAMQLTRKPWGKPQSYHFIVQMPPERTSGIDVGEMMKGLRHEATKNSKHTTKVHITIFSIW